MHEAAGMECIADTAGACHTLLTDRLKQQKHQTSTYYVSTPWPNQTNHLSTALKQALLSEPMPGVPYPWSDKQLADMSLSLHY